MPLALATVLGLVMLWPGETPRMEGYGSYQDVSGVVSDVSPCRPGTTANLEGQVPEGCTTATVRLSDSGRTVEAAMPFGPGAPTVSPGDRVLLFQAEEAPPGQQWQFVDFDRSRPVLGLIALFAVAVVVLSRWRGLASLVSLGLSLALVVWFVLPNLLGDTSPLLVAIVAAATIMFVSLYLTHGFNAMTSAALVGTLLSLILTGVIGGLFTTAMNFTGFSNDSTKYLAAIQGELNYEGLILAALIIGALGVLDDVTVTQAAAVWELSAADPSAGRGTIFSSAMRIGRAHVSAAVNTLVLAYVSAMLPLLVLLTLVSPGFTDALFSGGVAEEVARGLVGSLGIIAAVPITTLVAVLLAGARTGRRPAGRYARVDD